jgi:hypothetical protein
MNLHEECQAGNHFSAVGPPALLLMHTSSDSSTGPRPKVETRARTDAPEWLISNIAEASKNAQQVFFALVSLLVYSAVSIIGTSDRQVILNSTIQLPILNTSVSLNAFFILAPLFSLLVFVYLQLYLQRLKGLIRQLRNQYAKPEPRRLYPWALTIADDPEPGSVGTLQKIITAASLWWLLPNVLLLFAVWSVRKHSPWLSYLVCAYPLIALVAVIYFWSKYREPHATRSGLRGIYGLTIATLLIDLAIAAYIIPVANFGRFATWEVSQASSTGLRARWNELMRELTCADLSYQILVTEEKKEYDTYWVNLESAHLEGANLDHAILKLANLRSSHFEGANLKSTTLRTAMLEGADFQNANMDGTDLSYAKLVGANNLLISQVCRARTLYKASVDPGLESAIKAQCPQILTEASQNW